MSVLNNCDSIQLLELLRDSARTLQKNGKCKAFMPINRSNENRVDCYIFDSPLCQEEVYQFFKDRLATAFTISVQKVSPELFLLRETAEIVELLLKNYSKNDIIDKLFREHFHYIFNSLGYNYESESQFYYNAYTALSRLAKGTNAK